MNGQQLFDKLIEPRDEYSRVLFTALTIEGDNLYKMLEEAEKEGKKIVLKSPIDNGPSEPYVTIG